MVGKVANQQSDNVQSWAEEEEISSQADVRAAGETLRGYRDQTKGLPIRWNLRQ